MTGNGTLLGDFPKIWRKYKEIITYPLKSDGMAINFLSDDLKHDKDLVQMALSSNPDSIEEIPRELVDKEMVTMALKAKISSFNHIPFDFKKIKKLLLMWSQNIELYNC